VKKFFSEIHEDRRHNQIPAICADIKEVKTTNLKGSAKEEDESSPYPPDRPDLTPSDFHLFDPLKDVLRGRCFADDDDSVLEEFRRFSKGFYATGLQRFT
jgi:hypothetical protein